VVLVLSKKWDFTKTQGEIGIFFISEDSDLVQAFFIAVLLNSSPSNNRSLDVSNSKGLFEATAMHKLSSPTRVR